MRLLRSLALLAAAALLARALTGPLVSPLAAQTRVVRDTEVRATPEGVVIATLGTGTAWTTGTPRGGFTPLTVEGWVSAGRMGGPRDSFPATIGGAEALRIRAEASITGRVLGVFVPRAGVHVLEQRGTWARVRRTGWVLTSALGATMVPDARGPDAPVVSRAREASPAASSIATAPSADPATPTLPRELPRAPSDGAMRATAPLPLRLAPGTTEVGTLENGAIVEPIARERGWVRIRVEAWVPESLLVPVDSMFESRLTAADLRLDPIGFRGRLVRWKVQVVSLRFADPLRRALAPDEPYLLAMGPGEENAILYLAVPPSLLAQARTLSPLADVLITARVRNGRSEPTGVPVLDLISVVKQ